LKPQERKPDDRRGRESDLPPARTRTGRIDKVLLCKGGVFEGEETQRAAPGVCKRLPATAEGAPGKPIAGVSTTALRAYQPRQLLRDQRHGRPLHGPAALGRCANL
jgi:hypothetical protein